MPIYHTDLVMNMLDGLHVLVYADGMPEGEREKVLQEMEEMPDGYPPRKIYKLTKEQYHAMCANVQLVVNPNTDEKILSMSSGAFKAFGGDPETGALGAMLTELSESMAAKITHSPIPTIESKGGGSKCCLQLEGQHKQVPLTAGPRPRLRPSDTQERHELVA